MIGCLAIIPAALLPIFLEETAGLDELMRQMLCAQIRQESSFNCEAGSPAGAVGCAQFLAATWNEEAPKSTPSCEGVPRTDEACSFRLQRQYMRQVRRWVGGMWATLSDQIASDLAAYNGGAGNVRKERRVCRHEPRCSPSKWWGNVERHCKRSAANCRENRDYPVRIFRYAGLDPT